MCWECGAEMWSRESLVCLQERNRNSSCIIINKASNFNNEACDNSNCSTNTTSRSRSSEDRIANRLGILRMHSVSRSMHSGTTLTKAGTISTPKKMPTFKSLPSHIKFGTLQQTTHPPVLLAVSNLDTTQPAWSTLRNAVCPKPPREI